MNKNKKRKNYKAIAAFVGLIAVSLFAVGGLVRAYSGGTSGDVFESGSVKNVYIQLAEGTKEIGEALIGAASRPIYLVYDYVNGFYVSGSQVFDSSGNATLPGTLTVAGETNYLASTEALTASNTIAVAESNKFFFLSGATSTQTLPAYATAGQKYTFYVSGALTGDVTVVTSGGENVINGTVIVAGAVVDCDSEDTLTFVSDGENVGDFFSLISTGSGWVLGESGALTASKLTCTAT